MREDREPAPPPGGALAHSRMTTFESGAHEERYQNSERRAARPSASIAAMRAFT